MDYRRRKNMRLSAHEYASEGMYYVTICTEGRVCTLGRKEGRNIRLSDIGKTALESWQKLAELHGYLSLDSFVLMPNHIHGIIIYHACDDAKTLGQIIRDFKSFTTHEYYKDKFRITGNLWQRGYYDRIIRCGELDDIRAYINTNPENWEHDPFFVLETEYLHSLSHN